MNLNEILKGFEQNPGLTKLRMFNAAYNVMTKEIEYWTAEKPFRSIDECCEFDDSTINYSHYFDVLGWPNFLDDGIFYQSIKQAATVIFEIYEGRYPKFKE